MSDTSLAQHPPAVKVGGRRLSISSKPKHHTANEPQSPTSPTDPADAVDYPRPGPPGQDHHEDDGAKKEKKHNHGNHEHEKRNKESPQWKVDSTRPTRDILGGRKDFGAGGRIAQPAGKGFAG